MIKKLLLILFLAAILVIGGGAWYLTKNLDEIVRTTVVQMGSEVTQTEVALDAVNIGFTGSGQINGLSVANPQGYTQDKKLVRVGEAKVSIAPMSLLEETIVIKEVIIRAPEFTYQQKLGGSNVKALMDNIERYTGPKEQAPGETAPAEEPAAAGKKIILEHYLLEDAKVHLMIANQNVTMPLPKIELRNIGADKGGILPAEMAQEVSRVILAEILKAVANSSGKLLEQVTGEGAQEAINNLTEQAEGTIKGVEDQVKGLGDSVKGMFNKK